MASCQTLFGSGYWLVLAYGLVLRHGDVCPRRLCAFWDKGRAADLDRKKPTLCVCIRGQMRNFEPAFERLQSALGDFDVHYFVSVWKNRGTKVDPPWYLDQLALILPFNWLRIFPNEFMHGGDFSGIPALWEYLNEKNSFRGVISESEVHNLLINSSVDIESEDELDNRLSKISFGQKNVCKMFHKIKRTFEMVSDFEKNNHVLFDYFLSMRPNILIAEDFFSRVSDLEHGHLVVDWVNEESRDVADSFAFGHRSDMDAYCKLARGYDGLIESPETAERWRGIHFELFESLANQGIKMIWPGVPFPMVSEYITELQMYDFIEKSMAGVDARGQERLTYFKYTMLSQAALEVQDYTEALRCARVALDLFPESAWPSHFMAQALAGLGNETAALRAAFRAAAFSSEHWIESIILDYACTLVRQPDDLMLAKAVLLELENKFSNLHRVQQLKDFIASRG